MAEISRYIVPSLIGLLTLATVWLYRRQNELQQYVVQMYTRIGEFVRSLQQQRINAPAAATVPRAEIVETATATANAPVATILAEEQAKPAETAATTAATIEPAAKTAATPAATTAATTVAKQPTKKKKKTTRQQKKAPKRRSPRTKKKEEEVQSTEATEEPEVINIVLDGGSAGSSTGSA